MKRIDKIIKPRAAESIDGNWFLINWSSCRSYSMKTRIQFIKRIYYVVMNLFSSAGKIILILCIKVCNHNLLLITNDLFILQRWQQKWGAAVKGNLMLMFHNWKLLRRQSLLQTFVSPNISNFSWFEFYKILQASLALRVHL